MRLKGFDYRQSGAYFVTLRARPGAEEFGVVANNRFHANEIGQIVADAWMRLARNYTYVGLDAWVLAPDHFHEIITIHQCIEPRRGGSRTAPTGQTNTFDKIKPLGRLIGAFKTVSTKRINLLRNTPGMALWQRNFYEHIIRDSDDHERVRRYIESHPALDIPSELI